MRKAIALASSLATVAALSAVSSWACDSRPAASQATAHVEAVDFGVQRTASGHTSQVMTVANSTPTPVEFSGVGVGCGCISIPFGPEVAKSAEPGGSLAFTVILDRERMAVGKATYPVAFNVRGGGRVLSSVSYEYDPALTASPAAVVLMEETPYDVVAVTTSLDANDRNLAVRQVSGPELSLEVEGPQPHDDGRLHWVLRVGRLPHAQILQTAHADVTVTLGEGTEMTLPVTLLVTGDLGIRVEPDAVLLHPGVTDAASRVVQLRVPGDFGSRLRIEVPSPAVRAELTAAGEDGRFRIVISADDAAFREHHGGETFHGQLRVYVGDDPAGSVDVFLIP